MGLEMRPSAWEAIRSQPFYDTEEDYILHGHHCDTSTPPTLCTALTYGTRHRTATHATIDMPTRASSSARIPAIHTIASRKRPRRSAAAAVKSYAVEVCSSDEEDEAESEFESPPPTSPAKKRKVKDQKNPKTAIPSVNVPLGDDVALSLEESEEVRREAKELYLWVEHLSQLLIEENQKVVTFRHHFLIRILLYRRWSTETGSYYMQFKVRKQGVERDQNGRLKTRTWKVRRQSPVMDIVLRRFPA